MVNGYTPKTLEEAVRILAETGAVPYAGGTDLMIEGKRDACYLFLHKIPEMNRIIADDTSIRIGACCTYTQIADHPLTPAILREAVLQIAAPAIRNLGTPGGNIANGSPKADSALIFMATDSVLRLSSIRGERMLPIRNFYLGRKQLALEKDELIVEILIPRNRTDSYYYKKVGARNAMAISRVSFAGLMQIENGRIVHLAAAFGAISDRIVRRDDLDAMLIGKTVAEARQQKDDYLQAYDKAIVPIRGRISAEYRKAVCMNLLRDFLEVNGIA